MIEIIVNGKTLDLFFTKTVSTDLNNLCDSFSVDVPITSNSQSIKKGDSVIIQIDGVKAFTGWIEARGGRISGEGESVSAVMTYSGRSLACDLVDSSVPEEVSSLEGGVTLADIAKAITSALKMGIKTIDNKSLKPFESEEILSSDFGGKATDVLLNFARKRSAFMTSDADGNIEIFVPPKFVTYVKKLTDADIQSREFSDSDADRFNVISIGSQANFSAPDADLDTGLALTAQAIDPTIRVSRYIQISSEVAATSDELTARAEEEVNIRRARGLTYSFTVAGHTIRKKDLIRIEDTMAQVSGVFLVCSVEYNESTSSATQRVVVCLPESFSGVSKRTSENKSKIGTK